MLPEQLFFLFFAILSHFLLSPCEGFSPSRMPLILSGLPADCPHQSEIVTMIHQSIIVFRYSRSFQHIVPTFQKNLEVGIPIRLAASGSDFITTTVMFILRINTSLGRTVSKLTIVLACFYSYCRRSPALRASAVQIAPYHLHR